MCVWELEREWLSLGKGETKVIVSWCPGRLKNLYGYWRGVDLAAVFLAPEEEARGKEDVL